VGERASARLEVVTLRVAECIVGSARAAIMDEGFRYHGFDVHLEVWESRNDVRIRWLCGVTLVHRGIGYAASFSGRVFDWPADARRYAELRAKKLIDSYTAGDVAVLGTPVSPHRPMRKPEYPPGAFSDSRSRF
jgi:hypothetical protein